MMQWQSGKWLVICDRCGFKRMSDQVVSTWDNLIVCKPDVKMGCFETRHPQDFVRGKKDDTSVAFVRTRPADIDVSPTFNCDACEPIRISSPVAITFIAKGYSVGPMLIPDTLTVTIYCEWTIV